MMPWEIDKSKKKGKKTAVVNANTGEVTGYSSNPRAYQKALYANSPDAGPPPVRKQRKSRKKRRNK